MTTDTNGNMVMPVAPMYGGGYGNNGGDGMFGGGFGGWWIILFLIVLMGWGNNGWGNNGGNAGGYFPWVMAGQQTGYSDVQRGFDQSAVISGINNVHDAVTSGFAGVQQSLCSGFAGVNATVNGAQNALAQQLYGNEIASLNRSFAEQSANAQGFNAVQNQLAQCCCDNRLATCQTQNLIQADGEATRNAILTGVQSIKDQLCQDKIDAKNDEIAQLRQTIAMKDLAASQTAQNAFIAQGFSNEVDQLYNRLNNCPVPTTPVYGRTPIFTCGNNCYAGCGCGAA